MCGWSIWPSSFMIIKKMRSSSFVTNWQYPHYKTKAIFPYWKFSLTVFLTGTNCFSVLIFFFHFDQSESLLDCFLFLLCLRAKAQKNDPFGNQDNWIKHFFICLPPVNATETTPRRNRGGNSKAMLELICQF